MCLLDNTRVPLQRFPLDPLPRLEELTIRGGGHIFISTQPMPPSSDTELGDQEYRVQVPVLRRLHWVDARRGSLNPSETLAFLVEHGAPSLTHLRFSGITLSHGDLPLSLAHALGTSEDAFN